MSQGWSSTVKMRRNSASEPMRLTWGLAERSGRHAEPLHEYRGEHEHGADRCALVDDQPAAGEDDQGRRGGLQHLHEGAEAARDHRCVDLEVAQVVVGPAEARLFGALAHERLDQQRARDAQHLLQVGGQLGELAVGGAARRVDAPAGAPHRDRDQRQQHQRDQRQAPIEGNHQAQRRPCHERVVDDAEHGLGDDALDGVDVIADPRHDLARAIVRVKPDRLVHQSVEELLAQVEDDALADPLGQIVLGQADQAGHRRRRDARADEERHVAELGIRARQLVDQSAEDQRRRQTQQGADRDAPERQQGRPPVRQ
jgi:hypothetical protein